MDYLKLYNNIIKTRKSRLEHTEYCEKHHILPKCLGGTDDSDNLVILTYREHYLAHWLLTKIYPKEPKIHYAFLCMLRDPHGNRKLTSKMVHNIKTHYSEFKRWHSKIENPGKSENSRKKAFVRMSSEENPMKKFQEKNPFLNNSFVKGRTWYNNGVDNLYLYPHETIPEGYVRGMKPYTRKRNGKDSNHK
jgi:hypothetical protein